MHRGPNITGCGAFGLIALLCCAAPDGRAAPPVASGTFLVADEGLDDPGFYHAVVLVLHHDADGSVGLIVNQQSDLAPTHLLPDVEGLERYRGVLYLGGPVDLTRVTVLSRSDLAGEAVIHGVYLSNDAPSLEGLVADGHLTEDSLRIFIGYAGWEGGQLEAELSRGAWHVAPATGAQVFRADPGTLWKSLRGTPAPVELLRVEAAPADGPRRAGGPGRRTAPADGRHRSKSIHSGDRAPAARGGARATLAPEWLNW